MSLVGDATVPILIGIYLFLLLAHGIRRLMGCKHLYLVDAFLLGQFLYTLGSVFVWFEGVEYSGKLVLIALLAGISGLIGVHLAMVFFRRIDDVPQRSAVLSVLELRLIDLGLVVCSLVSAIFLAVIYANDELRYVFHEVLAGVPGALNQLRLDISSGVQGYFAPGYVKQFRDIAAPILCAALVLKGGLKSRMPLFLLTLVLCCLAIYVSGQRLVILQYIICLSVAGFVAFSRDRDLKSISILGTAVLILCAFMVLMTIQLGRTNVALSPAKMNPGQTGPRPIAAAGDLKSGNTFEVLFTTKLSESSIPGPVVVAIALIHRSVIAVPRENAMTIEIWEKGGDYAGAGWVIDLGSIRVGTQKQISNELSAIQGSSDLGNSPLGLPADLFFNWGFLGVCVFPFVFALLWMSLDRVLLRSPYVIVHGSRLFLFFSVPLMYSPFMFVLYGGVIILMVFIGMSILERVMPRILLTKKGAS